MVRNQNDAKEVMGNLNPNVNKDGIGDGTVSYKRFFYQPGFSKQNPNAQPKQAFLYGFFATILCVVVWLVLIYLSYIEADFLVVLLGIITGFAIRLGGKSTCKLFGTIAIVLTLCGSMAGLVGSRFIILPHKLHVSLGELVDKIGLFALARISLQKLEFLDFIFLVFAVIVAYLITNPIRFGEQIKLHK